MGNVDQRSEAMRIQAAARALEKAWLRDGDRRQARKLVRAILEQDWKPLLTSESLEGIRFRAIRAELAGKPEKALQHYLKAEAHLVALRAERKENQSFLSEAKPRVRGTKKKHLRRLRRKIAQWG